MTTLELERRLATVEAEVASLKAGQALPRKAHPSAVLEEIHNTFENDAAIREAMRLGRKWRQSGRPNGRVMQLKKLD